MKHQQTQTRTVDAKITTAEIAPSDCGATLQEFGRCYDVQRLFGLKRGFLYGLINAGLIKSVCLRKPGSRTGCRLIHLQSVRDYLTAHLDGDNGGKAGAS